MKTRKSSKVNSILEQEATPAPGGAAAAATITEEPTGDALVSDDAAAPAAEEETGPTDAPTSSVPKELQESDSFKAKIIKNFQKGNPTIIYEGKLYSIKKLADGKCDVSELQVGVNNRFKMYSAIMGKKIWEIIVTEKGLKCKPSSGSTGADSAEPTLIDDSAVVVSDVHEIFPLKDNAGNLTEMMRIAGDTYIGKVNESKGGDEWKIWNLVCKTNKIPGRKITKTYLADVSTAATACRILYKAIDGWGTDEDAIIKILQRVAESENAAGTWMMMLYGWDNNHFGRNSSGKINSIPQDIVDFAGGIKSILNIFTLGAAGTLTQAWKENVGFSKNTPIYGANDDTDLESGHRGLLMDICEDMEDQSRSDQTAVQELLKQLVEGLPNDNYAWRIEDSATGDILISTGDSNFNPKKKKYLLTAKAFQKKYSGWLGDLLGDDDWEGGQSGGKTGSSGKEKTKGSYWSGAQGLIPDAWEFWK